MNSADSQVPGRHPDIERVLGTVPGAEAGRLREVWDLAAGASPADVFDATSAERTERLLASLVAEAPIRREHRSIAADRPAEKAARRRYILAALPVLLLLVAGAVWATRPFEIDAPAGARVTVALPDGSTAILNSGSTLRGSRYFMARLAGERAFELTGEAFFDVVPGGPPFVVRTADARLTVLGTRFGVRAWSVAEATTAAVLEGRVRFESIAGPEAAVTLAPGVIARLEPGARIPTVRDGGVDDALAWRAGDLIYKDEALAVILGDIERRFGVTATARPEALGRRRVSLALRSPESAESVMRDLATALGLRYRRTSDGLELFAPNTTL